MSLGNLESPLQRRRAEDDGFKLHRLQRDASTEQQREPLQFGESTREDGVLQDIKNIEGHKIRSRNLQHQSPFLDPEGSAQKKLKIESPFNRERVVDPVKNTSHLNKKRLRLDEAQRQSEEKNPIQTLQETQELDCLSSEYDDVPPEVREEILKIEEAFPLLRSKYRLLDRIGEGTFSTVYKAEPLSRSFLYLMGESVYSSPENKSNKPRKPANRKHYVALKRIYVTSSPQRIWNELNLLFILSGSRHVAPLLDAIREDDQIIAVLPYYEHIDFREFYRDLPLSGIRHYMSELLEALKFVHTKNVLHRDIKPTNFLYDPFRKRGVLVDFGLAEQMKSTEREPADKTSYCPCKSGKRFTMAPTIQRNGMRKNDTRGGRRANRAGTRGFRAPEVLLKCPHQNTKIDVWSVGVILLTFLSRRFPFFNSRDDIDALVELTTIFGVYEMKKVAHLHGLGLETTLPTLAEKLTLPQLVRSALLLEHQKDTIPQDSVMYETLNVFDEDGEIRYKEDDTLELRHEKEQHIDAFEVMELCLKLDPKERGSADQVLMMPFFNVEDGADDDEIILMD